jgi:putative acyl-CoA dehydrogenase
MQNVLADLALETEAAALLAFRLAGAFDRSKDNESERQLVRLMTPVAKYWLCKRLPPLVLEAMECLGGNGYVEEAPLARLYREAPLNGIWEGSGNVICLDVLRSLQKEPGSVEALLREVDRGGQSLGKWVAPALTPLMGPEAAEPQARRVVEAIALALQASLMVRYASTPAAEAFSASRLEGNWGRAFGTLAAGTRCAEIVERQRVTP